MDRTGSWSDPLGKLSTVLLLLVVGLGTGCGYMPRTGNQMENCINERDQALREEMNATKQELLTRFQNMDQRLGSVDE